MLRDTSSATIGAATASATVLMNGVAARAGNAQIGSGNLCGDPRSARKSTRSGNAIRHAAQPPPRASKPRRMAMRHKPATERQALMNKAVRMARYELPNLEV